MDSMILDGVNLRRRALKSKRKILQHSLLHEINGGSDSPPAADEVNRESVNKVNPVHGVKGVKEKLACGEFDPSDL